uniref:Uncharacterized protein n=1 Tax=Rhizophora mucronata TaxID=61149 RepID=A0A2P2P7T0_RHIMU
MNGFRLIADSISLFEANHLAN